jgi:DNA-directed RNA polymerase specialized sigma24 family protein
MEAVDVQNAETATAASCVERMLRSRELEKIARDLERKFPAGAAHADDAVANAVVRILALASPPAEGGLGSYLYRAAQNDMCDHLKAIGRLTPLSSLYEEDDNDDGVEEQVLGEVVFQQIRERVATWTNRNVRAVTLAAIDAAYRGVVLGVDELAHDASEIRGETLSRESVSQWKTRGLNRLRDELAPDYDIPDTEEN